MSRTATMTGAFRRHVIDMPPGSTLTTVDAARWVKANLSALGSDARRNRPVKHHAAARRSA